MARINQQLLERLERELKISTRTAYRLIDRKAAETLLDWRLAALAVARENRINVQRYSTPEDRAELRQHFHGSPERAVPIPVPAAVQPASSAMARARKVKRPPGPRDSVFVIHGRNRALLEALHAFLRSLGLRPIEWSHALRLARNPNAFIPEIIDAAFEKAAGLVVLLTGDDEARLRRTFWKSTDPRSEKTLTRQARPNVLFEAGLAFARKPNSTILVQVGEVKAFSDAAGRHVLHLTDAVQSRKEFIIKLRSAGLKADDSGTEWMTAGSFRV